MPPVRLPKDARKAKNPAQTIKRLLGYLKPYRVILSIMFLCLVVSAIVQVLGDKSLQYIIDNCITPMIGQIDPNYAPLIQFITLMAGLYCLGIFTSFLANFLLVKVGQGTQKTIRDAMFIHMQKLPIRYFDTHPVGDVMSRYTNDIDTLRQMITQSLPQCVSSICTILVVLISMLTTSWVLTLVVMCTAFGILLVTKTVAGKSVKFFIGQQRALGDVNGYVEEMINGQRVVKVFCHENVCK